MSIINHLQHRIEETRRELACVDEQLSQLQAQRTLLATDLNAYEKTAAAEMRRESGSSSLSLQASKQTDLPLNGNESHNGVNKAEWARQFVREHAATGVTTNDLFEGFQSAGIQMKKPYIYSLVSRLKEQGSIRERRNKYYPVMQADSGDSDSVEASDQGEPLPE